MAVSNPAATAPTFAQTRRFLNLLFKQVQNSTRTATAEFYGREVTVQGHYSETTGIWYAVIKIANGEGGYTLTASRTHAREILMDRATQEARLVR